MKMPLTCGLGLGLFLALASVSSKGAAVSGAGLPPESVQKIIKTSCLDCHSGKTPAGALDLSPDKIEAAVLNRPSLEKPDLKLADPAHPEQSYFLMKILGSPGITGSRMPQRKGALKPEDVRVLTEWVKGLKGSAG